MRTILMGEAPGQGFDGKPPFSSRSGDRLRQLLGVEDLTEVFEVRNILARWPGKGKSKGAAFPLVIARARADEFMQKLYGKPDRRIIFVGGRVAKAFRTRGTVPMMEWTTFWRGSTMSWCQNHHFAILPHPSGVNRWWNEPENVELARQFLLDEARLTGRLPS